MDPNMRPVVVVADQLPAEALEPMKAWAHVREVDGTDRAALKATVADADALIVRSATTVDREVIAAAPRLQVVGRAGVGLDNIDSAAAEAAGVHVVNTPDANTISAAEHTCALILAAARRVAPANRQLKDGTWDRRGNTGVQLAGKTLSVIGFGRIGRQVARRMASFDMHVLAHDPTLEPGSPCPVARAVSLAEAVAEADVLTLHLPRTPGTTGLIGAALLTTTRPGVILVNTSRGGIVDEAALAGALATGRVGAAGLDVFAEEPCTDSPLFAYDQVVVTPHLGASTHEAQAAAARGIVEAVTRTMVTATRARNADLASAMAA